MKHHTAARSIISIAIGEMIALILFPGFMLHCQDEPYSQKWRWAHFTTESGLPSNDVTALLETTDSTVWVGTAGGLAWYDGFQWHRVDSSIGSPGLGVTNIYSIARESIFVATVPENFIGTKSGISRLSVPGEIQTIPSDGIGFITVRDTSLLIHRDGKVTPMYGHPPLMNGIREPLWVSARGGFILESDRGIYHWSEGEWKLMIPPSPDGRLDPSVIVENSQGIGLASIRSPPERRGVWEWNRVGAASLRKGIDLNDFTAADINSTGDAIVMQGSGELFSRIGNIWSDLDLRNPQIKEIRFLKYRTDGSLWIGTSDGLFLYNLSSKRWTNCKLTGLDARNRVNEIVRARDKSLWLATEGGLVVRRPDGSVTTIREIGGRSLGSLTGLIEDDEGRIWCSSGAAFDGAYRWDGLKWEYFPISNDPAGVRVHKIRKDRFGRIWFLAIGKVYSPQLGTDPGAFVYENGRCRKWGVAEGLLSGRVYSFAQGQDGSLWFGTWRGLSRWKDNRWTYWTSKEGLRGDVYSLAIDHQNRVWLGNLTAELAYIQNDSVKYVQTDECPLRGAVWDMQLDETGGLWISGRTEVVAYRNGKWFSFTPKSGMEQSKIWPVLPSDDKVFVGTFGKGVDILNLDQKPSPYPRVLIEKALIEHETVLLRWHAFAFWGEQPENEILTRYSVDDRQWSSWSMGKDVTIEGLDPGNHRLEVQAKGLLADFETPGARASFFIESPYYQRPLFLIPGLAGFATIMWLGVALVVRKRRHAASLRQSELKFRRLTEATFEGIAIHDRGVILDANESILKMFGYSYDEFVGKSIQEIAAQESHLLIDESMTSDPERAHEVVGIRKDGSKIIIEITSKSIPYEHRSARVIAVRDISERKKSEEQLLAYQEQLRTLATEVSATEERERRRMAEYLHDHIGQALAMCKLKLEAIKNGEHSAKIDESRQILQQVIDHTRSLTLDLSPPVLRELSFADAIEWLTVQFQNQHNILIYFEDDKQPKTLGADLKTFLYHAVRELLTNIIKHARAQSAEVILRKNDNALFIEVKDDGIGLDSATIRHRHDKDGFGLFNIRERLRHYGGSLDITPLAEEGTCIVMTLPLTPTQDHE